MDIQLIYVIKLLLLPPAIFIVLIGSGWFFRRHKVGEILFWCGWGGLLIFSLPVTVTSLASLWEAHQPIQMTQVKRFNPQAIVVLGGGIKKSGDDFMLKPATLMRLHYAAKLAENTGLPILVSGGRVMSKYPVSEAEMMAKTLSEQWNIKPKWLEQNSRNTAENARLSWRVLQPDAIRRIILVTQAYHMPRALAQFEQVGFTVLPAPMDFMSRQDEVEIFSFIPSASALYKSYLLLHEWLGRLWYRLRY